VLRGVAVFRALKVGRCDVGEPRVSSHEDRGAMRGESCSVRAKVSIVWRQGWKVGVSRRGEQEPGLKSKPKQAQPFVGDERNTEAEDQKDKLRHTQKIRRRCGRRGRSHVRCVPLYC